MTGCGPQISDQDRDALVTRLSEGFATQAELDVLTTRLATLCMEKDGFQVHPELGAESVGGPPRPYEHENVEVAMGARIAPGWHGLPLDEVGYGVSPYELVGFDVREGTGGRQTAFDLLPFTEQDRYWIRYHGYTPNEIDYTHGQRVNEDEIVPPQHEAFTRSDGWVVYYPLAGCLAEVQRELFAGEIRRFYELASYASDGAVGRAGQQVSTAPEVVERTREWSSCMAKAGHDGLATPTDAMNRAAGDYGAHIFGPGDPGYEERKQAEISLATADYQCNEEVSLDQLRAEVFWRNLAEHFRDREAEILEWHNLATDAKGVGQQMLSRAGAS